MLPIRFLLGSIALQIVGFAAMLALSTLSLHQAIPLIAWCLIPYLLSKFLSYPTAWKLLNLFLPIGIFIASEVEQAYFFGFLLLFTIVIYLPTFWTRVPYYPTHSDLYDVVLSKLPTDKPFTFIDLGCGFGDLLMYIANHRPNGKLEGVEIGVLPFLVAYIRSLGKKNISIKLKSIWSISLKPFDFVYAFLAPPPMKELFEKCKKEMPSDSMLLVNCFPVPGIEPNSVENLSERSRLFTYAIN